ncbi:MAG: GyrI-like domain-containing protein [Myxococcales bacterium]
MAAPPEIQLTQLAAQQLAVVKDVAFAQNIGAKIGAALPVVFAKLKELGVKELGQPVVVYFSNQGQWHVAPGIPIEVGVELAQALSAESPPVVRSSLPACRAATALHLGPYQALPQTHMAVHDWCHANGHTMTGRNWEIYGEHHDDPAQLRTQVCYELV